MSALGVAPDIRQRSVNRYLCKWASCLALREQLPKARSFFQEELHEETLDPSRSAITAMLPGTIGLTFGGSTSGTMEAADVPAANDPWPLAVGELSASSLYAPLARRLTRLGVAPIPMLLFVEQRLPV